MNSELTIGIDLGGTRIKAALVGDNGRLTHELNEPSLLHEDYSQLIERLGKLIEELLSVSSAEVTGIGLAVAGLMNRKRKIVVASPNCPPLIGESLPADLTAKTGLHTIMDNDANMMAVGEGICGAARGSRHYVALTLGTGIGGAVISGGRLIRGIDGGGGELGHIPIDRRKGPLCGCGARGCLEAYIGRDGTRRFISRNMPRFRETGMKDLTRFALEGDEEAQKIFTFIGETLGVAVAGLVNIFNPDLVVVGGGVAAAAELFFAPLREEIRKRAFKAYQSSLEIKPAELGNWAGVVGAASLARKD